MGKYKRTVETLKRMLTGIAPESREKATLRYIWAVMDDRNTAPRLKLARIQAAREALLSVTGDKEAAG